MMKIIKGREEFFFLNGISFSLEIVGTKKIVMIVNDLLRGH